MWFYEDHQFIWGNGGSRKVTVLPTTAELQIESTCAQVPKKTLLTTVNHHKETTVGVWKEDLKTGQRCWKRQSWKKRGNVSLREALFGFSSPLFFNIHRIPEVDRLLQWQDKNLPTKTIKNTGEITNPTISKLWKLNKACSNLGCYFFFIQ